jgi:hypothetical protein
MRAPDKPSPKAREAAAIEHIVDLIRTRIAPDGDDAIINDIDPFEGDPEFAIPSNQRGTTIATGETVAFGNTFATGLMVRQIVNFLQDVFANTDDKSPWGIKSQNKNIIDEVNEQIEALQQSLSKVPRGVGYLLFSTAPGDGFLTAGYYPNAHFEKRYTQALAEFSNFAGTLGSLHDRCIALIKTPPGEHALTYYPHKLTAMCAADILVHYGVEPTRGNEGKPSLFEQITSSLFEAATGEAGANLAHACREFLKPKE